MDLAGVSSELFQAQEHLLKLRASIGSSRDKSGGVETRPLPAQKGDVSRPPDNPALDTPAQAMTKKLGASNQPLSPGQGNRPSWSLTNTQQALKAARRHAGLESTYTAVNDHSGPDWQAMAEQARTKLQEVVTRPKTDQTAAQGVRTYPTLSLAALKGGNATTYRIWLLARHFDGDGRGYVYFDEFKNAITAENSHLQVFTRQRAGQIFREGEGLFWTFEADRDGRERLRYAGAAQLAAALGVERLAGDPVFLDPEILTANIGRFKADLYASFHAGRADEKGGGRPISRAVQEELTGHSTRTLQRYDRRANMRKRANFVLNGRYTAEEAQEQGWEHGQAVFEFTDHKGKQGRPGSTYVARQLPNSYTVIMPTGGRGRQREINRNLTHPRDNGARGAAQVRIFHDNPVAAAKAFNRRPDLPNYWPYRAGSAGQFWGVISM